MKDTEVKFRTMTLAQVIEAANRAVAEVATWPLWKQKLSYPDRTEK